MNNKNWLIRTRSHHILGPVSKDKIIELLQGGSLNPMDEVCSGNGHWIFVKEEDLIQKYIFGNEEQSFNPLSEAQDCFPSGSDIKPATSSVKTKGEDGPESLANEPLTDIKYPSSHDLAYPILPNIDPLRENLESTDDFLAPVEKKQGEEMPNHPNSGHNWDQKGRDDSKKALDKVEEKNNLNRVESESSAVSGLANLDNENKSKRENGKKAVSLKSEYGKAKKKYYNLIFLFAISLIVLFLLIFSKRITKFLSFYSLPVENISNSFIPSKLKTASIQKT